MKVPFNINLSGKTAIVTGGSGTLCSAMAYGLAVCGAKVAIIGRNKEKLASVSEKLTKDAGLNANHHNATVLPSRFPLYCFTSLSNNRLF